MSLLMKALEKAAKDREGSETGRAVAAQSGNRVASATGAKSELTLEPLAAQAATPRAAESRESSPSARRPAGAREGRKKKNPKKKTPPPASPWGGGRGRRPASVRCGSRAATPA